MGAKKIVNENEVVRWFEEGKTYAWMVEEYRRKYNIDTVPSLWGNFRRRRGLARRITRNDELVPWNVKEEHRWAYPLVMLRVEARRRDGRELRDVDSSRLTSWLEWMEAESLVVHYDPDTADGFFYIPRGEQDTDLVRQPEAAHRTHRPAAD